MVMDAIQNTKTDQIGSQILQLEEIFCLSCHWHWEEKKLFYSIYFHIFVSGAVGKLERPSQNQGSPTKTPAGGTLKGNYSGDHKWCKVVRVGCYVTTQ